VQPIIQIENISKLYRLGEVGTGTMRHDLKRWWAKTRGKEDPFAKVGQENDRTIATNNDYVWALKNINFTVAKGEILGIIGKNGAGKSTLLKILSKTTAPTTGVVKLNGQIASLLEVGTGFHPELTGRENIFLNGAILGMRKKEIQSKLDAIVDFAGVARYLDTPVKRYSSGMYVRLAFAVAAHLDPDILIVDEVLAVGDAEFQKKCLGKMKEVSDAEGRTVLFVSHNLTAVKTLCTKAVALRNGLLVDEGSPQAVIDRYLNNEKRQHQISYNDCNNAPGNLTVKLKKAQIQIQNNASVLSIQEQFTVFVEAWVSSFSGEFNFSLNLFNGDGLLILNTVTKPTHINTALVAASFVFPANLFNTGTYSIELMAIKNQSEIVYSFVDVLRFDIVDGKREGAWVGKWSGVVRPLIETNFEVFNNG
jgi:lipopolysaccharide transport system ATP-binding protein